MSEVGWCSLRLRFDARELQLLRGAERLRGTSMAHTARSDVLRSALSLAKAGQKVGRAVPGATLTLEEGELRLLLDAVRFAAQEVQWGARRDDAESNARRDAVLAAFPELVEKGTWRSFGLARELEAVAAKLADILKAHN
jgi:hypothetical protein